MRTPRTVTRARLGRATTTCGALTTVALTLAAALRVLADGGLADRLSVAVGGVGGVGGRVGGAQALDDVTSAAAGVGVLLLAVTLTVAVLEHRSRGLALVLGAATLAVAAAATVLGVLSVGAGTSSDAFALLTWRTALAAIAGACLPAVVLAAARTRDLPARPVSRGRTPSAAPTAHTAARSDDAQRSTSTSR